MADYIDGLYVTETTVLLLLKRRYPQYYVNAIN